MKNLGKFIVRNVKVITVILILITLVGIYLSTKIVIRPNFLDLLPKDDPYVEVYKKATKNFKSVDNIIIGIEGDKKNIINYINNISEKLKAMDHIDAIYYKQPIEFLEKNLFLLTEDKEQDFFKKIYTSTNIVDFFKALNAIFEENKNGYKMSIQEKYRFEYMLDSFKNLLESIDKNENIEENLKSLLFGEEYLLSKKGNFGLIIIRPTISSNDIEKVVNLVNSIENTIKKEAEKYNVKAGLTGTLVIARDEMVTIERDMSIATIVSIFLIITIFMLGFKSFRYMILAVIPLILGIIWTIGFTQLTVGSLNIMTVMMAAILAGLGIDYSIHMISLFIELRNKGYNIKNSIIGIFEKNIRGIIAGAITTAIGMGIFAISSFPGFKEFGIVLSSGIIFTLLASIFGLTILLYRYGNKYKDPGKIFSINIDISKYRKVILLITILLLIFSFIKIPAVEFEKDMMKIEAKGLESLELNQKILENFNFSPDNTIFINKNIFEARELYNKLKKLKVFYQVDSIVPFLPDKNLQIERIKKAREIKNTKIVKSDLDLNQLKLEINKLNFNILKASISLNLLGYKDLGNKLKEITTSGVLQKIIKKDKDSLNLIQNKIINTILKLKNNLNDKEIITQENLPEDIKSNYLGSNGMIITTAYSNGDIWNSDYQKEYFKELKELNSKDVSGTALIFLKVVQISAEEGKKILLITLLFIFIILILDMKSLKYAILAMIPMILSIIFMLGVMGWFGIKFNVVNIIALPLIIGIGVDDGIHLIHRYRREKNLKTTIFSTGKAITMTTLTTGVAFGSFILSKYRGFAGFGVLLLLGVIFSYIITIFVITSILSYEKPKSKKSNDKYLFKKRRA
ncbi:hypothetical protein SAMN02745164_01689 [Marinitoga hydrogenitolerans DSM 16785]|uniref:SSD domain-containing protein n=1 Tax=Marinitoga hydrogenitolerans (strain DSM 16785 / JCM 12826 / AT1271) TaxID=1122195 RepID=A0A1M4YJ05_MARH1|nr:MMPL family transporter [Marinitoga hydrogenitolerans]SHF05618.1 hypothetical protein SAMN02745164_01689 [Marinitoga hydrogenitolerans DSM 16785]